MPRRWAPEPNPDACAMTAVLQQALFHLVFVRL